MIFSFINNQLSYSKEKDRLDIVHLSDTLHNISTRPLWADRVCIHTPQTQVSRTIPCLITFSVMRKTIPICINLIYSVTVAMFAWRGLTPLRGVSSPALAYSRSLTSLPYKIMGTPPQAFLIRCCRLNDHSEIVKTISQPFLLLVDRQYYKMDSRVATTLHCPR